MRAEKHNVYENIVAEYKALIESGALTVGEKLPSVRVYAVERRVNPNTVAKAYAELENTGYIVIQPKKGAFVAAHFVKEKSNVLEEIYGQIYKWKEAGVEATSLHALVEEVYFLNGQGVKKDD